MTDPKPLFTDAEGVSYYRGQLYGVYAKLPDGTVTFWSLEHMDKTRTTTLMGARNP